jgi:hypothetical protein
MTKSWDASVYAPRHAIGLDIGQAVDFSALAVVSQVATPGAFDHQTDTYIPIWQMQLRWLERPPLGTAFGTVVSRAVALRNDPSLIVKGDRTLGQRDEYPPIVLDSTGVGAPLVEMFQTQHDVDPVPISITGGAVVSPSLLGFRVPKQDLIAALSVQLELRQLKIARELTLAGELLNELKNFKMQTSASTGRTTFNAAEGFHDDLLIATALATWWLQTQRDVCGLIKIVGI